MTTPIVCGIDFSDCSAHATRAAAAIAERLGRPLTLVHSGGAEARARLEAEAAALGVPAQVELVSGSPDQGVLSVATRLDSNLIIVGSLGSRKQGRWRLGSVAERIAQASKCPVLVVRDGAGFEAWARQERPLRILVAVELTPVSQGALAFAESLRAIGACDTTVVQIAWPAEEQKRAGIPGPVPLDRLRPELEEKLLAELRQWAGGVDAQHLVKPGWGRVDVHVTKLADELKADLIVVGTNQRAGIALIWQGSVSRGILAEAHVSVACVPLGSS